MDRIVESREIKDRCLVVKHGLELLPPAIVNETIKATRGTDGPRILRGDRGELYGQFHDSALAEFTRQAPGHLRAFMAYIEKLEEVSYDERKRRREVEQRLTEVTDELLAAERFGITSRDGLRRVRSAIASVYDRKPRPSRWAPEWV